MVIFPSSNIACEVFLQYDWMLARLLLCLLRRSFILNVECYLMFLEAMVKNHLNNLIGWFFSAKICKCRITTVFFFNQLYKYNLIIEYWTYQIKQGCQIALTTNKRGGDLLGTKRGIGNAIMSFQWCHHVNDNMGTPWYLGVCQKRYCCIADNSRRPGIV